MQVLQPGILQIFTVLPKTSSETLGANYQKKKGSKDNEVTVVVSDICVIIPQTISGATGELKVLRLLEAMMEGGVINAGDIQKAIEHIL